MEEQLSDVVASVKAKLFVEILGEFSEARHLTASPHILWDDVTVLAWFLWCSSMVGWAIFTYLVNYVVSWLICYYKD